MMCIDVHYIAYNYHDVHYIAHVHYIAYNYYDVHYTIILRCALHQHLLQCALYSIMMCII